MEIKGKVHCFFEQSGTFKNEFKKLGIPAEDYDIQNNFNQTDNVIDLFAEIEAAYMGGASVFDDIEHDDLIMAFFPCIYFETVQQLYYALLKNEYRNKTKQFQIDIARERLHKRTYFHDMLYKLLFVCYDRQLRLIIENPATVPNYLMTGQNFPPPTMVDIDRTRRGDVFKKPTAYWFINCKNENKFTWQRTPKEKIKIIDKCKKGKKAGVCSEERSMISPTYAHNFICDNILGIEQDYIGKQLKLFEL